MGAPAILSTARTYTLHSIPALRWAPVYLRRKWRVWLVHDIIASLALAALAAPEALSYAGIAGVPLSHGLYAAYTAPLAYALFGSSPQLVTGPTTIVSVLTRTAMDGIGSVGGHALVAGSAVFARVAAFLAVMVGLQQVVLAAVGGAALTSLLSSPIIAGFTSGSALVIAGSQLSKLFGVGKCKQANGNSCSVPAAIASIFEQGDNMRPGTPLLSLASVTFLLAWKYGLPRLLPAKWRLLGNAAPMLLLIMTAAIAYTNAGTFKAAGIALAGAMPAGVPGPVVPVLPDGTTGEDVARIALHAIPITIIGYMEALSIGRTVARQFGYGIDDSQEMVAAGASNLMTGFAQGLPVTASFSRTAVNVGSGARSAMSGLFSSAILMVIVATLMPALQWVPEAALGSVVISVIFRLVEVGEGIRMWRSDKRDFLVALAVFIVIVCSTVPAGLVTGVALQWVSGYTRGFALQSAVALYVWRGKGQPQSEGGRSSEGGRWQRLQSLPGTSDTQQAGDDAEVETGLASAAVITTSPTPPVRAAVLQFAPDLQFPHTTRLRRHMLEVLALYRPLTTIVLDLSGVHAIDYSGACALLQACADVAEGRWEGAAEAGRQEEGQGDDEQHAGQGQMAGVLPLLACVHDRPVGQTLRAVASAMRLRVAVAEAEASLAAVATVAELPPLSSSSAAAAAPALSGTVSLSLGVGPLLPAESPTSSNGHNSTSTPSSSHMNNEEAWGSGWLWHAGAAVCYPTVEAALAAAAAVASTPSEAAAGASTSHTNASAATAPVDDAVEQKQPLLVPHTGKGAVAVADGDGVEGLPASPVTAMWTAIRREYQPLVGRYGAGALSSSSVRRRRTAAAASNSGMSRMRNGAVKRHSSDDSGSTGSINGVPNQQHHHDSHRSGNGHDAAAAYESTTLAGRLAASARTGGVWWAVCLAPVRLAWGTLCLLSEMIGAQDPGAPTLCDEGSN